MSGRYQFFAFSFDGKVYGIVAKSKAGALKKAKKHFNLSDEQQRLVKKTIKLVENPTAAWKKVQE